MSSVTCGATSLVELMSAACLKWNEIKKLAWERQRAYLAFLYMHWRILRVTDGAHSLQVFTSSRNLLYMDDSVSSVNLIAWHREPDLNSLIQKEIYKLIVRRYAWGKRTIPSSSTMQLFPGLSDQNASQRPPPKTLTSFQSMQLELLRWIWDVQRIHGHSEYPVERLEDNLEVWSLPCMQILS